MFWTVLGCNGCNGLRWTVLGCTGLHRTVLACGGLCWDVLGSTGLYWALLGCDGLCGAVIDCTGVYWALLGGVNSYFSVYSAIFGMVTNERPNNQVILEQACS